MAQSGASLLSSLLTPMGPAAGSTKASRRVQHSLLKARVPAPGSPSGAAGRPPPPTPETLRLERALNVEPFVRYVNSLRAPQAPPDSSDDDDDVLLAFEAEASLAAPTKRQVECLDRARRRSRYIDRNLGASDQDDDSDKDGVLSVAEEEARVAELLKVHAKRKKIRKKLRATPEDPVHDKEDSNSLSNDTSVTLSRKFKASVNNVKSKAEKDTKKSLTVDQLNSRRRRLWLAILKKEVSKAQKARAFNQKEKLANCKRTATQCMRVVRQRTTLSQRVMKETVWRAKRLTREMQAYWKRFDRAEKQQKRQQEKELEEQAKLDVQLLEAKRQQRKLNFLITQTELYAHFIAKKIGDDDAASLESDKKEGEILNSLDESDEGVSERLAAIDDYDSAHAKVLARNNASQALEQHRARTQKFDSASHHEHLTAAVSSSAEERSQPGIFSGTLKNYQVKGMNWLMDLYDQGINGILADEMGLGKTVQALAMLSFIAEKYHIWGPFLVITPASTLHNWQQEVARFVPKFRVVPYWGSTQERKTLRHFWDQKNLHTKNASFHVVITSYQLVITDFKYFNRVKWQYLVLDEAQAIKSSSSQRWKMLLEFKCRNRLLLSGTPIQNSMAELWSLLHFVMPTLFDSHEEFNDWFSKDIESSAESKGQVDKKQISRLHMILKPFMLRRIKRDVENELTDKLEVLLYCPLTIRQRLLYMALKRKIKIDELLQGLGSQTHQSSAVTTSLMNLVMQFRKVCNHPELFERREVRSPFAMDLGPYVMPKLLARPIHNVHIGHILYNRLSVFNPANIHYSLKRTRVNRQFLEVSDSAFSYLRFVGLSPQEQFQLSQSLLKRLQAASRLKRRLDRLAHVITWHSSDEQTIESVQMSQFVPTSLYNVRNSDVMGPLIFTGMTKPLLGHVDVKLCSMPETTTHRLLRSRQRKTHPISGCDINEYELVPEVDFVERLPVILRCEPCDFPLFLTAISGPKVCARGRQPYASDRAMAYRVGDHLRCGGEEGLTTVLRGPEEQDSGGFRSTVWFSLQEVCGLWGTRPRHGFSNIVVPDKQSLVSDSGKLQVLDSLLARLKSEGHRVLIYSQMTRMIDLLEEYMYHRRHTFIRLDGSSKISDRRDMVADFQQRADIFVFLLSTRAGGLGINLTAADTVIFFDSDWNPTMDQQAMDRAHRLGQTKQVTVYRLVCKGTIEERILQRAREKSEIQRMVIQGGSFKGRLHGEQLRPKEVVSLLLDDEEIEKKYRDKQRELEKSGKRLAVPEDGVDRKKAKRQQEYAEEEVHVEEEEESNSSIFNAAATSRDDSIMMGLIGDDSSNSNAMAGEFYGGDSSEPPSSRDRTRPPSPLVDFLGEKLGPKRARRGTGSKRGRPRGSKRGGSGREDFDNNGDSTEVDASSSPVCPLSPQSSPANGGSNYNLSTSTPVKRGPGRPRLRPGGPLNQGSRRPPKQAKPAKLKSKGLPAALAATLTAKYRTEAQ